MPRKEDLLCDVNKTVAELKKIAKTYNESHDDQIDLKRITRKKDLIHALMDRGECDGEEFVFYDDDDDVLVVEEDEEDDVEFDDEILKGITGGWSKSNVKKIKKLMIEEARKKRSRKIHSRPDPNALAMTSLQSPTFALPPIVVGSTQPFVTFTAPSPASADNFVRTPHAVHPLGDTIPLKVIDRRPEILAVQATTSVFMYGSWKLSDMQKKCSSDDLLKGKPAVLSAHEIYFGGSPVCSVTIKPSDVSGSEVYGTLYTLLPAAVENLKKNLSPHYTPMSVSVSVLQDDMQSYVRVHGVWAYRRKGKHSRDFVSSNGCRPTTSQLDEIQAAIDETWPAQVKKLVANYF